MKVAHYSDQYDPLLKKILIHSDYLFCTGDLSIFDFREVEKQLDNISGFGVYGNHCSQGYLEELGITNVHLKVSQCGKLTIGGYQGCLRYKTRGDYQFTENEASSDLATFPYVDILLLHAPPFGLLDDLSDPVHSGSKAVRQYVDIHKPKFIFCGHDSPSAELTYGETMIYRTHQSRLIEI